MGERWRWPILGVLAAIAVTSAMDARGLAAFSALPLAPLFGLFWYLQRFSRRDVGFAWGRASQYGLAIGYPIAVMAVLAAIAALAKAIDLSHTNWTKAAVNLAALTISTVLVAILTEEGFFRGWLWASLRRAGWSRAGTLVFSSLAFAAWHWSAVLLKTGFEPPRTQVPVYLANAAVIGAAFGLLRWRSGSIIVSSVCHGVWNGLAYVLFGFGTRNGALGIQKSWLFGPEVGVLGLFLNVIVVAVLWKWATPGSESEPNH